MSDDLRLGLVIAGLLLVVLGVVWRTVSRHREVSTHVRQFGATQPRARARAGVDLVDLGLSRASRPILAHVRDEPDPRVRLAIALAIGRRQWEPSNSARVRKLREWAAAELTAQGQPMVPFGPAVTRLSDMGGPRPPDADEPAPTPTPAPSPAALAPDPLDGIDWSAGPTGAPDDLPGRDAR